MLKGVAPTGKRDCDTTALEKNAKLAQRFGLRGTPAVYLASGEQVGGYVPADKLEAALAAAPLARPSTAALDARVTRACAHARGYRQLQASRRTRRSGAFAAALVALGCCVHALLSRGVTPGGRTRRPRRRLPPPRLADRSPARDPRAAAARTHRSIRAPRRAARARRAPAVRARESHARHRRRAGGAARARTPRPVRLDVPGSHLLRRAAARRLSRARGARSSCAIRRAPRRPT